MLSMVFQWFLIFLPSLSMVFDGSGPLVKRCDGFDGSLWSSVAAEVMHLEKRKLLPQKKITKYLKVLHHIPIAFSRKLRGKESTTEHLTFERDFRHV